MVKAIELCVITELWYHILFQFNEGGEEPIIPTQFLIFPQFNLL